MSHVASSSSSSHLFLTQCADNLSLIFHALFDAIKFAYFSEFSNPLSIGNATGNDICFLFICITFFSIRTSCPEKTTTAGSTALSNYFFPCHQVLIKHLLQNSDCTGILFLPSKLPVMGSV